MTALGGWLAAALLVCAPGAVRAQGKSDVEAWAAAFSRLSLIDRLHAQALARYHGADAGGIAVMRQRGFGWEDSARAASVAKASGLDLAEVGSAHAAGHGWPEVGEGAKVAASSGFSLETVLTMRDSGQTWPEVAAEVRVEGVDMRDAPRDPAPSRRAAAPKAAAVKAAPKAVVIKGKGPKMDPERLRGVW